MSEKFEVPSEVIDLPSKGLIYPTTSALSKGEVELYYMTAKHEDILTNINLLRAGTAIEKLLKSLIKTPIEYDELSLGDRNALLVASRILAYGKDYSLKIKNPNTQEEEVVVVDLQNLKYKTVDFELFKNASEVEYTLPFSKNLITFKILTVSDDKKIDEEAKNIKKVMNQDAGASLRLKYQITSIEGDRSTGTIRKFVDNALLARDSNQLRSYIALVTPDVDMKTTITFKDSTDLLIDVPMQSTFFFPGLED